MKVITEEVGGIEFGDVLKSSLNGKHYKILKLKREIISGDLMGIVDYACLLCFEDEEILYIDYELTEIESLLFAFYNECGEYDVIKSKNVEVVVKSTL